MTERENFFAIARRKGYERMPVQFNLCPYLQQTCGEKIRALQEETGFAFSPAVSARGLPVRETDTRPLSRLLSGFEAGRFDRRFWRGPRTGQRGGHAYDPHAPSAGTYGDA